MDAAGMAFHLNGYPNARNAALAGTFNGWGSELTPLADADGDTAFAVLSVFVDAPVLAADDDGLRLASSSESALFACNLKTAPGRCC